RQAGVGADGDARSPPGESHPDQHGRRRIRRAGPPCRTHPVRLETKGFRRGRRGTVSPPPSEFHTVTPRIVVSDATAAGEFLRAVLGAAGEAPADRPAEMRIGDSLIMVSAAGEREVFPAFLYIYVDDADATYQRAITAGATSIEPPLDTPYGDRRAMVRDAFGNVFQVAHRL